MRSKTRLVLVAAALTSLGGVGLATITGGIALAGTGSPAVPPLPTQLESWSQCTATLCLDAPPEGRAGLDGSGGWGWDNSINAPVTTLTVGTPAGFTVTVLQPSSLPACSTPTGSITLTYSSQDFSLSSTDSRGITSTTPFDRGGAQVWSYSGDFWCHTDQSVAYTFTPQNPTAEALVTATVQVGGQEASETFPIVIRP